MCRSHPQHLMLFADTAALLRNVGLFHHLWTFLVDITTLVYRYCPPPFLRSRSCCRHWSTRRRNTRPSSLVYKDFFAVDNLYPFWNRSFCENLYLDSYRWKLSRLFCLMAWQHLLEKLWLEKQHQTSKPISSSNELDGIIPRIGLPQGTYSQRTFQSRLSRFEKEKLLL